MRKYQFLRIVGVLVCLSGGIAWAQVTTGTISGTVKDSQGAAAPGTQIVILSEETGISRTLETDSTGRYSALSLSLGSYRVTATHEGFQTEVRRGIVLTVGREAVVDLSLSVGAVTQTVEVTGEAPLVETTTAALSSLVDERTIRQLPLNGRSYDQLALLQPGVVLNSYGSGGTTAFLYGTGKHFSVGGQRPIANSFLLDGTNINDQANGTPGGAGGTNLGVDTILEFKIFTSSFKAEFGHSNGSVTSAITRSGTNTIHGTVFEYIRNSVLDARNFFDTGSQPPPFKRNQFGGVLGGPIKKDKTFFFAGYEGLRQVQNTTLIAQVPTALARQGILPSGTVPVNPAIVPYLNLYPLPNGRDFGDGTAQFLHAPATRTTENYVMGRVDHRLNEKTSIFGRYTFDNDSVNAPQLVPPQVALSASRRQYTTLQANSVLSSKALNSFRFAYNRTRSNAATNIVPDPGPALDLIPGEPMGMINLGGISAPGQSALSTLGAPFGQGPFTWAFNIFEWGDDFTYVVGKHSLKTGVDLQLMRDYTTQGSFIRGEYDFNSYANFLAGKPFNMRAGTPLGSPAYQALRQSLYAVYVQDDYTVNSRLTLNLGLRWEATTDPYDANGKQSILPSPMAPAFVNSDKYFSISKKNFEPRFGLAWRLNESGKTVLRAGGGIYHNQILPWLYWGENAVPPFSGIATLANPPFPNGYLALAPVPNPIGNGTINAKVMAPFNKVPVNDEYNVSLQQQLPWSMVLQVSYAGGIAKHNETVKEGDTAVPTFLNGNLATPFYPLGSPRRNPAWAGVTLFATDGNSTYNAGTVMLRRQTSAGIVGEIHYTYSKTMDDASNTGGAESTRSPNAILNPYNPAQDWGLADFDMRHVLGANFSYPLPIRVDSKALGAAVNGWTLNGIATFTSGLPFTPRLGASVSRDLDAISKERPDLKPGFSSNPTSGTSAGCTGFAAGTPVGTARNWFDPCSFSVPAAGTYGNLGRNTIIGPGVMDVDLSLEKNFKLGERANVMFRAEMFNIMNHPNFGIPNVTALQGSGAANGSAGVLTNTITSSRQIQFGLRIDF